MKHEYRLSALDEFRCLADKCPASCCAFDWDVKVDRKTHDKWRAIQDQAARDRLITGTLTQTRDDDTLLVIAKTLDRKCIHLEARGLCSIQAQQGADYLPETCRDYPRLRLTSDTREVFSAALSCPEIARLALFEQGRRPLFDRRFSTPEVDPRGDPGGDPVTIHLDRLVASVMDEKRFPLNVKIYFLGATLSRLSLLAARDELSEMTLKKARETFKQDLFDVNLAIKTNKLRPDPSIAGSFWGAVHKLGKDRHLYGQDPNTDPLAAIGALLENGTSNKDSVYTEIYQIVLNRRQTARTTYGASLDDVFEKYLRVAFMNNGFPWKPASANYIAAFINSVLPFALMQLTWWMTAGATKPPGREDIMRIVYQTERSLGHSRLIYRNLDNNQELLRLDRYLECLVDIC